MPQPNVLGSIVSPISTSTSGPDLRRAKRRSLVAEFLELDFQNKHGENDVRHLFAEFKAPLRATRDDETDTEIVAAATNAQEALRLALEAALQDDKARDERTRIVEVCCELNAFIEFVGVRLRFVDAPEARVTLLLNDEPSTRARDAVQGFAEDGPTLSQKLLFPLVLDVVDNINRGRWRGFRLCKDCRHVSWGNANRLTCSGRCKTAKSRRENK